VIASQESGSGIFMKRIGEDVNETPQKVSYHVNRLNNLGLVEKEATGRRKNVYATNVGKLYLQWTQNG
jgi:DNA-binding MarR family transcriptional regulator